MFQDTGKGWFPRALGHGKGLEFIGRVTGSNSRRTWGRNMFSKGPLDKENRS